MERHEIAGKVIEIAKRIFNYDGEMTAQTKATDVKAWDSMNQIRFIAELEGFYKIKFKMKDIITFNSIGSVIDCLEKLL